MHSAGSRHTLSHFCCFISNPALIQSSTPRCEAEKAACCCTWALLRAARCCSSMWIKDTVTVVHSRKINLAFAGHCLVCAIQNKPQNCLWAFPWYSGPWRGVSNYCRSSGVRMSGEMLKGEKNIQGKCHCMVICKLCTDTEDHSSFPHRYPVPFSLGDSSSFCCFIQRKWIVLPTSGIPRVGFLYMSYLCEPVPQLLLPLVPWRGELFLLYYFYFPLTKTSNNF